MPRVDDHRMLRQYAFADVAARVDGPLHVLEVGTARCDQSWAEHTDGWSTKYWAKHVQRQGGHIWSVDKSRIAIGASKRIVPKELHRHVTWIRADNLCRFVLRGTSARVNVIYLDAGDDPVETLLHLSYALWIATPRTFVLLDDTQEVERHNAGKGTYVLTLAARNRWERVDYTTYGMHRMALVIRG